MMLDRLRFLSILAGTPVFLATALGAGPAAAQGWDTEREPERSRSGERSDRGQRSDGDDSFFSIAAGVGLTDDPDTALFAVDALFELGEHVSLGPWLQIGVEDSFTLVSLSGNVRVGAGLDEIVRGRPGWSRHLSLFGTAGLGFTHVDLDGPGDPDDTELLLNFGAGVAYALGPRVSLESSILYNFTPDDVFGEELIFSWQALTLRYHF